jgi:shikimate dehydrogenase
MTYGKELTPFLKTATQLGAKKIIDGLGMLVGQAAESFYIWTGIRPSTDSLLKQLREELN